MRYHELGLSYTSAPLCIFSGSVRWFRRRWTFLCVCVCAYASMPACMSPACTTAALCMRACVFRTNDQLDQVMCVLFLEPSGDFWENYLGFSWRLPIGLAQWSAWAVRNYGFSVHVGFLWLCVDLVLLFSHLLCSCFLKIRCTWHELHSPCVAGVFCVFLLLRLIHSWRGNYSWRVVLKSRHRKLMRAVVCS